MFWEKCKKKICRHVEEILRKIWEVLFSGSYRKYMKKSQRKRTKTFDILLEKFLKNLKNLLRKNLVKFSGCSINFLHFSYMSVKLFLEVPQSILKLFPDFLQIFFNPESYSYMLSKFLFT